MQKKLIAAAVVSALAVPTLALADSANVTISGDLRMTVQAYKLSEGDTGAPAAEYNREVRVADQGSRVILTGTEDIGSGLKSFFYIDSRLAFDMGATGVGTGISAGNALLGVKSDSLGQLGVGRWDSMYVDMVAIELYRTVPLQTFLALGPMMQMAGQAVTPATRIANVLQWDSPNWSGITARFGVSTNPTGAEGSGKGSDGGRHGAVYGNVKYAAGPIVAGVSFYESHVEGEATNAGDVRQLRGYFGWTFPFGLKVGVGVDQAERRVATADDDMSKRLAYMVPVTYSMGNHNFYATFAKMADYKDGNGDKVDDSGATAFTVGWDMALSKRTFFGAYYTKLKNDAAAGYDLFGGAVTGDTQTSLGEGASVFIIGYRHTF